MGAMENKSLNIFNTIYVQGRPDMSTDSDLAGILCVIGKLNGIVCSLTCLLIFVVVIRTRVLSQLVSR